MGGSSDLRANALEAYAELAGSNLTEAQIVTRISMYLGCDRRTVQSYISEHIAATHPSVDLKQIEKDRKSAITRLKKLYDTCIEVKDVKTARQVATELHKMQRLYDVPPKFVPNSPTPDVPDDGDVEPPPTAETMSTEELRLHLDAGKGIALGLATQLTGESE